MMSLWLMRSSKREYLETMQKQGELYMHSLKYYCECEDEGRRDKLETVSKMEYWSPEDYPFATFNPGEPNEIRIKLNNASLNTHGYTGYVFCMHHFGDSHIGTTFEVDLKDDYIIIITDPQKFIDLFVQAVEKLGLKYGFGAVNYMNFDKYTGNKNPFQKDIKYQPESEYRFFIPCEATDEVFTLYIGDISDISQISQPLAKGKRAFKIEAPK